MIGNVVSIVVAPPAHIGDSRPKYLTNKGAPNKANISRKILAIKAIVPSSAANCAPSVGAFNSVIKIDERE